jgi:glutaminase
MSMADYESIVVVTSTNFETNFCWRLSRTSNGIPSKGGVHGNIMPCVPGRTKGFLGVGLQ